MAETKKSMYNGGSAGVLYTDRRDFYVSPQVVKELWTDVAPFTTVISNRETRKVPDPIFKMFEHRNPWVKQKCLVNGTPTLDDDDNGDTVAVDGIVGLVDGPDNSWVGLIFEFWNTAETTKAGTAVVTAVSGSNLTMKTLSGAAFSPCTRCVG